MALPLNLFPANGMTPTTGYGRAEIGLIDGLLAVGVDARLATIHWRAFPDAPTLLVGYPTRAADFPAGARLWSYTMSETDRLSPEWVQVLNSRFERVLVPCPALVEVYRASGVVTPVTSVGLPMDTFAPPYRPRNVRGADEPFTFLTYSLGDIRKGADLVLFAFNRLFRGDPRFKLIVKGPAEGRSWLDGCADQQVEIVRGKLDEPAWQALLDRADGFVFASRGEGFGMPPREAVLSGLPTIATQWLGMADVAEWGYPIPVAGLLRCHFDSYEANADGACWAQPDDQALGETMRWLVDHYDQAVEKTHYGRIYLRDATAGRTVGAAIRTQLEAL